MIPQYVQPSHHAADNWATWATSYGGPGPAQASSWPSAVGYPQWGYLSPYASSRMIMYQAQPTPAHAFAATQHPGPYAVQQQANAVQIGNGITLSASKAHIPHATGATSTAAAAAGAVPSHHETASAAVDLKPEVAQLTEQLKVPDNGASSLDKQFQSEMIDNMHANKSTHAKAELCNAHEIDQTADHVDVDHRLSKAEAAIESALRRIFPNHRFVKVRPTWLTNIKTRRRLEIDLYCESLALGIERGGVQHYVYPNGVHASREAFEALRERDLIKRKLSKVRGVLLIDVPFTVSAKGAEAFLRDELRRLNFRAGQLGQTPAI